MIKILYLILVTVLYIQTLSGQVPKTISDKGVMTNPKEQLDTNGEDQISLALYDDLSTGSTIWNESQAKSVDGILINVILRASNGLPGGVSGRIYAGEGVLYEDGVTKLLSTCQSDRSNDFTILFLPGNDASVTKRQGIDATSDNFGVGKDNPNARLTFRGNFRIQNSTAGSIIM